MKRILQGQVRAALVAPDQDSLVSIRQPEVRVTLAGFEGDRHAGLTMRSGGRTPHFPRGTEIRNSRQVSIVSVEDLDITAAAMKLPALLPEWYGANLLIEGIPALTLLPPATRLFFQRETVLVVEGENYPCTEAGASIQAQYPDIPGLTTLFPRAGLHLRGIVAWVERGGMIHEGDTVEAHLPEQEPYPAWS
jgi:MOSC domain-containing protein YiiM